MTELEILSSDEKELLKTKASELEWEIEVFPESMILIPTILEKTSKAILDDSERARIPPDYDHLIEGLFKLIDLDGKQPEFYLAYQKNDSGKDTYKLRLVFEGVSFERALIDARDYYDSSNVRQLVNEILKHNNAKFELISIETDDQGFCLYKGDRSKIFNLYKIYNQEYLLEG